MDFEGWLKTDWEFNSNLESGNSDCEWAVKFMRKAFEASQQSKQAEIDGLEKKLKYEKSAYRNIKLQFLNKQDDLDELQKRINDALSEIESGITGKHHVKSIIKILKGELK